MSPPLKTGGVVAAVAAPLRWLLGFAGMPAMARPTFRYEFLGGIPAALAAGALLPEFVQLFAKKALLADSWLLAILVAMGAAAQFAGAFFAQYLQTRRRVPYMVAGRFVSAAALVALALLPVAHSSAIPYALLLLVPALMGALILNVQSGIWHTNYPSALRGSIFARFVIVRIVAVAISVKAAAWGLDHWPLSASHVIYAAAAALMVCSGLLVMPMRVRGEKLLLKQKVHERFKPLAGFRVLWRDRAYGQYMLWQMVSGSSVLMTAPVVVLVLTEAFGVNYASGATSLVLIPSVIEASTCLLAGRLFDHMDIMRYRAINACLWALSRSGLCIAFVTRCWPAVLASFAMQGLAQSSGGVVWSIGHTRFARVQDSQLYMGIHMTLTGLRGLTMPFIGIWLYSLIGPWVIGVAAVMQFFAAAEFLLSHKPVPAAEMAAVEDPAQDV